MKIKFLNTVSLEIVTGIVDDIPEYDDVTFQAGEQTEIDICDDKRSEIQFGDGDVAFVLPEFWDAVEILHD